MRSDDYKQLQIERLKLVRSFDEAKLKVAGWLGKQEYDEDDEVEAFSLMTTVRGLGSAPPPGEGDLKSAKTLDAAFEKLTRAKQSAATAAQRETAKLAAAKSVAKPSQDSDDDDKAAKPKSKKRAVSAFDAYKRTKKRK